MKRNHSPNFKSVTCDKCSHKGTSCPGKVHRRCPGQPPREVERDGDLVQELVALRPKHQGIEPALRGRWQP